MNAPTPVDRQRGSRGRFAALTKDATFWRHVDPQAEGCWLWIGAVSTNGYGRMRVGGETLTAHRVSWELHNGTIPTGLNVLHKCDVKVCVRPDHLEVGTQTDNIRDSLLRQGRRNVVLNPADVVAIRQARARGATFRELAAAYDVRWKVVYDAATRRTWRHVA